MLVGRQKERELLSKVLHDEASHFVAVYGRRRVGKTFLIRETFGYRFTFQHAGLSEGNMKEQLFAFTVSLKDAGFPVKNKPKNWLEAFEELKDLIRQSNEKRKVIFIDEFMIFGGVPFYWSFLKKGLSLPQNIDALVTTYGLVENSYAANIRSVVVMDDLFAPG